MEAAWGGGSKSGRSEIGPTHPARQDVCRYYLQRALAESPLNLDDFAESLGQRYEDSVIEHARRLKFHQVSTDLPHKDFARQLGSMVRLVQTYLAPDGHMHFPAELEEAWCAALPEPYARQCRLELVRRHHCLGVEDSAVMPVAPADDFRGLAEVMAKASEVAMQYSAMLADGKLDERDAVDAVAARKACREAAALLIGLDLHIAHKTGLEVAE